MLSVQSCRFETQVIAHGDFGGREDGIVETPFRRGFFFA
jgi:hypothetical protein